jgi:methionine--tRNA ligase beta chain
MISIEDFKKIDLRVGKILSAERVEGSEKLVKLTVDIAELNEAGELLPRQILAGIAKSYEPEGLVGREIVIVANLEYRKLMGMESQGMLLAATNAEGLPIILVPERDVVPGAGIQ